LTILYVARRVPRGGIVRDETVEQMHSKEIKFQNFSGYLNNMYYYSNYGGMDWNDMYEVQSAFVNEHTDWCDTGYNNVLKGPGEAITLGDGGFQSHNLYRTFSLQSGVFASAWETNQPVTVNSYVYQPGQGMTLKASDTVYIGQDSQKINFANYGGDFKHISDVAFVSGVGEGGNTCSYGAPTYGYILVMDNLTVKWDRANPGHAGHQGTLAHHAMQHHGTPHLGASFSPLAHDGHGAAGHAGTHAGPLHDTAFHTAQFALPAADHHFGS
jgi:hypothetical protein